MSYPEHAFTITGGCDCGAIRWRLDVPELAKRPPHPFQAPGEAAAVAPKLMPSTVLCHCGFCRGAIGALPATYISAPAHDVTISAMRATPGEVADAARQGAGRLHATVTTTSSKDEESNNAAAAADKSKSSGSSSIRPPFVPATDVLSPGGAGGGGEGTWLRYYLSAGCGRAASRSFCGRCGTSIGYLFTLQPEWGFAMPEEGWTDLLDLVLATTDREWLENSWMRPAAQLNVESAIPWAGKGAAELGGDRYYGLVMGEESRVK